MADDILEVSSDDLEGKDEVNEDQPEGTGTKPQAAEEKKKKKNRRKKRIRKQKQLILQQQILKDHGKCTCECHSDLAALLAKRQVANTSDGEPAPAESQTGTSQSGKTG